MPDGWKVLDEAPAPKPAASGWSVVEDAPAVEAAPAPTPEEWRKTDFGFRVKNTVTHTGQPSVQREDGLVWYGPDQGNTGRPGWFDAKGMRGPDVPVKTFAEVGTDAGISLRDRLSNQYQEWVRRNREQGVLKTTMQDFGNTPIPVTPGGLIRFIREGLGYRQPVEGQLIDPTPARILKGAHDTVVAPAQTVANLVAPGSAGAGMNRYVDAEHQFMDQNFRPSMSGELIGQVAPFLLTGKAPAAVSAPVSTTRALAGAAAEGGFLAPMLTPEVGVQSEADFNARKLKEELFGAGLGFGGAAVGRTATAIKGRLAGQFPNEMAQLQAVADQHGVPLSAANLDPSLKKTEDALTHIPFSGMSEQRAIRQEAADKAAQKLLDSLKAKVNLGAGGTPSEVAQASARANHSADVKVGNQLYDALAELAGTKEAPRGNVIAEMQSVLAENARASRPDASLAADLEIRIRRLTQNSAQAQRAGEVPMDKSFGGLRDLASEFWKEAQRYEKGTPENRLYTRLHQAALDDIDAFVSSSKNPALESVNNLAKDWWKNKVKAFSPDSQDYSALAKQLRGKDLLPEKVMDSFIQANDAGKAKYFYDALDNNGRAAVRWGLVQDAYTKATEKGTLPFSPAKFATYMKNHQEAAGVFFKGADKWEIDGFTKLMRAIEESGSANAVPHTGKAAIFPMLASSQATSLTGAAGALFTGHPALAAGGAAAGVMPTIVGKLGTKLFTSPAGKKLLLAASSAPAGSKVMNTLVQRDLPKILGAEAKNVIPFDRTTAPSSVTPKATQNAPE